MALQVWLPLNGTLENKGINDMQFSLTNGAAITINENGKIGKCYERVTSQTDGYIVSNKTINLNGDLSICCWAKVTGDVGSDTAQGLISNHNHSNSTGFGLNVKYISADDYRICCSTGSGSSRTYKDYYGTTNIKNKWHHLTLTYNNTKKEFQLWVDGIIEKTQSKTNISADSVIRLFDWSISYSGNYYKPACCLNDIRIYNHCLSPLEVKEISHGLILHHKLDNKGYGNPNLLTQSILRNDLISHGIVNYNAYYNGKNCLQIKTNKLYTDSNNGQDNLIPSLIFKANTAYTMSLDCMDIVQNNVQGNLYLRFEYTDGSTITITTRSEAAKTQWVHKRITTDASKTIAKLRTTYSNSTTGVYLANLKIEEGDKETQWSPPIDELGTDSTDSSGYSRTGIFTGNPSYICDINPVRYGSYIHFDQNQHLRIYNRSNTYMPAEALTVCAWVRTAVNKIFLSCREASGFILMPSQFSVRVGNNYQTASYSGVSSYYNDWHFFVGTFDSSAVKIYIDGILKGSKVGPFNPISYGSPYFFIGAEASSTSTNAEESDFVGDMSDVRVYATALDENAIKNLYNIGMKIDNLNNIHTFEYKEQDNVNIKLYKTGQLLTDEINEISGNTQFKKTGQIYAPEFIER